MNILIVIVLGIEFVTIQHRSDVVLFIWLAFHFGEWIAFLFAQLLSHWIWITAVNSLIVLPCLAFVVFGTDETPQWILSQGMKYSTRLKAIFEKVNQTNRAKMDRHSINSIVSVCLYIYILLLNRSSLFLVTMCCHYHSSRIIITFYSILAEIYTFR